MIQLTKNNWNRLTNPFINTEKDLASIYNFILNCEQRISKFLLEIESDIKFVGIELTAYNPDLNSLVLFTNEAQCAITQNNDLDPFIIQEFLEIMAEEWGIDLSSSYHYEIGSIEGINFTIKIVDSFLNVTLKSKI